MGGFSSTSRPRPRRREVLAEELEGRANPLSDENFRDKLTVLKEKKNPGEALVYKAVNTLADDNGTAHHTYEYDSKLAVFRRGQSFMIDVTFDRNINSDHDQITLQLVCGSRPKESKGTIIRLPLDLKNESETTDTVLKCWKVKPKISTESFTVRCSVTSPPDAYIGYYSLYCDTKLKEQNEGSKFDTHTKFIIIFNPWCKDDTVYMEDDKWRKEYVMNEDGGIWCGSAFWNSRRAWNFGQFQEPVLEAVLYLLEISELGDEARRNPIPIVRTLTSFINSCDNEGVLAGRWSENYPKDSTVPWAWTGSVEIIRQYMTTKQSVRYGQCWVFSGVSTTLCRAIGIPTRSVTNFESAHDTDCSMTIDKHFNCDGDPIEHLNDSVWNFHVWNESWFKRLDLPDGYDGWQAHDATPQETSEGIMRCGPASVKAIKEGLVYLPYDVPFIAAEVNGDVVHWQIEKDDSLTFLKMDTKAVGQNITTQACGSSKKELLTNQYKYPENSEEERRTAARLNKFSGVKSKQIAYDHDMTPEVNIRIQTRDGQEKFGDDLTVDISFENTGGEQRSFKVAINFYASSYTSLLASRIKKLEIEESINACEVKTVPMQVPFKEYKDKMTKEGIFAIFVWTENVSTNIRNTASHVLWLPVMVVEIQVEEEIMYGEETKAVLSFTNTTSVKLTACSMNVECTGALKFTRLQKGNLSPGETWNETVTLKPFMKFTGRTTYRHIVAEFQCDNMATAEGERFITIVRKETDIHAD